MQTRNRRVFMLHAITGATALAVQSTAQAAEPAQTASDVPVKETDAYPKSMGYRLDTANVDKVKFPRSRAKVQRVPVVERQGRRPARHLLVLQAPGAAGRLVPQLQAEEGGGLSQAR